MLPTGTEVEGVRSGVRCRVDAYIGEGAQGIVYRVSLDGGAALALKWYKFPWPPEETRAGIERLVARKPPSDRFLWPLDAAAVPGDDLGVGYLMPLREPRYIGMADLVGGRVDTGFRQLATTGAELSESFLHLHNEGLCYRDINWGNVFLDPTTGSVLICDNDNVTVDGDPSATVLGTPYFMAPEVLRGESLPSTSTDLFSLAVLLFRIFLLDHPLEGKRSLEFEVFDEAAHDDVFGHRPLFIFDPADPSNEAMPGHNDASIFYWSLYPPFLRALFTRSFTAGLRDPAHGRVRESVWRRAMLRLRDAITTCPDCGKSAVFHEEDPGGQPPCWGCGRDPTPPRRLRIGRQTVVLNRDTELFGHHLRGDYDFSRPVARMEPSPDGTRWGLRNLTDEDWSATAADGTLVPWRPGRAVEARAGARLGMGTASAEVLDGPVG